MELVEGVNLDDVIPPSGMEEEDLISLGGQLADALAHAHERGIVHRDLKSSNVIVTIEGRLKVLDFGLAERLKESDPDSIETELLETRPTAGSIAGTLHYMSPEILSGHSVDFRGDVWAAGVVLYEMATGHLPFRGNTTFEVSSAILREVTPSLPSHVPFGVRRIIEQCLQKDPALRYAAGDELKTALETTGSGAESERPPARSGFPVIRALVVLPLENLSGDESQDYFADGMTEAITARVARLGKLRVISRTSAMQYKGTRKPLPVIARELGVDTVVEGSVVRSGDRVRITAQLIRAETDEHLWGETYDRDLHDILELQADVSKAIVEKIQVRLTAKERAQLSAASRVEPKAYEEYLKGRYAWGKRTRDGLKQGITHYRKAIDIDPTYALAYAGLAECYNVLGFQGTVSPRDSFSPAAAAARKALEIDDSLAEAHYSLGYASLHYRWNWKEAGDSFLAGLRLDPSYPTGHHWYALYLAGLERREEALAELEKATELDPLSVIIRTAYAWVHHLFREFDVAIDMYDKALDMNPEFWAARLFRGVAYVDSLSFDKALAALPSVLDAFGREATVIGIYGYALGKAGDKVKALECLRELEDISRRQYVRPNEFARVHIGLGETDKAIAWLERAFEEGGNGLNYMHLEPFYDSLRDDVRFQALVSRVLETRL